MGLTLLHQKTGNTHTLSSESLVGRGLQCDLRLRYPTVSSQHARVRWTRNGWELYDLASRNGTYLDGQIIEREQLRVGARIEFGGDTPETIFDVIDVEPPAPRAQRDDGVMVVATGRILHLPSASDPHIIVFHDGRDQWIVESRTGAQRQAKDGDTITIERHKWTLMLPVVLDRTWGLKKRRFTIHQIRLRFFVDRREQNIDIEIIQGQHRHRWPTRVHHQLLYRLATARLADGNNPSILAIDAGWRVGLELWKDSEHMYDNLLNQYVSRARLQFGNLPVIGAPTIIERRPAGKQMRIGVRNLELLSLRDDNEIW